MLKNYLITTLRNLYHHRIYTFINICGLAMGMACAILILLYVEHERSYDRYHTQVENIYRIVQEDRTEKIAFKTKIPSSFAPLLSETFPEIQASVRIETDRWSEIHFGQKTFRARTCVTDHNVFEVFTFPLVTGDIETALKTPYSVIITEKIAHTHFKDVNPIGQTLTIETKAFTGRGDYTITGIAKNIPATSTISFDLLTTTPGQGRPGGPWGYSPQETYVLLKKDASPQPLLEKFPGFTLRHRNPNDLAHITYHLQPLSRIHLYSQTDYGVSASGNINHVALFSIIAIFILLIACINFTNLATARSMHRAREVGLRKVVGAHRLQIMVQFWGESLLISTLSLLFAVGLVELALPKFNIFVQKNLALFQTPSIFFKLISITLAVAFLAGLYPAFFLSAFRPVHVLKGTLKTGPRPSLFRQSLVVFQFSIALVLIVGTYVVIDQVHYMSNKDLGYEENDIIIVRPFTTKPALRQQYAQVKHAFSQHPNILKASVFHGRLGWGPFRYEAIRPEGSLDQTQNMIQLSADSDLLDTFEMTLLSGVNLSPAHPNGVLLTETAAKQLGWKNPIGKQFGWANQEGTVIGVVKDFHIRSLHDKVEPVFLTHTPNNFWYLALKIRSENFKETKVFLEQTWQRFIPEHALNWMHLTHGIWNKKYRIEQRFSQMISAFATLAIVIACLGLFGLTSFAAEQRKKEVGIRKVLGASATNLVRLLIKDHIKLIAIANLIAWPIAYALMHHWLQQFAYQIPLAIGPFVISGSAILFIAILTIGYQTFKATQTNPVNVLHNE